MALVEDSGGAGHDPESQLNEWLEELDVISGVMTTPAEPKPSRRPLEISAPRIDSFRFSMANLEESQDADLDAILGELSALDSEYDDEISRVSTGFTPAAKDNRERNNQRNPPRQECEAKACRMARTDSPDNDSAFSDTVSMMSTESSASSSSSKCKTVINVNVSNQKPKDPAFQEKADKIKEALERMRIANIKKLFLKTFSMDGSSKSLLVDEKMTCGYLTRLLADKNHVHMEPKWAIVEHLPDLHMERVYEDHELLVANVMLWTRDSNNKIIFADRPEKLQLFRAPEKFLLTEDDRGWSAEHDERSRHVIIEEFFGQNSGTSTVPSVSGHPVPPMEGQLYLKSDSKKGWKKYHFVIRPSGLYYSPKEKVKNLKELVCLATFDINEVYLGVNWRKKYKSPTDYCFAIKHPRLQQPKSVKFIKFLCADDQPTLERWITAMRIAKHGKKLLDNHRTLMEQLVQEDLEHLARVRSCSVASIPTKTNGAAPVSVMGPAQTTVSSNASVVNSDISSICGRHSRASSSSSSGCLSDATASESAFDCEFPMGTIKRKPSMKPNIPLTWTTRQLKEMAESESEFAEIDEYEAGVGDTGTLTRRPRNQRADDSTLKRHHNLDMSENKAFNKPSKSHLPASGSPARQTSASPSYYDTVVRRDSFRKVVDNSTLYGYNNVYEPTVIKQEIEVDIEEFPLPPPPELDVMFNSTLSLESLPPPPEDLDCGSSNTSKSSSIISDKTIYAPVAAYGACLVELQSKKLSEKKVERMSSVKKHVNFAEDLVVDPMKRNKKITFADEAPPPSPRKPIPPKRNESTRLSMSPKKLVDSTSNPPKEFLKDLQRVMKKKWQVAQKCKTEPSKTPHEVLGFREYPSSEEFKENNVSMWVEVHYGDDYVEPSYENVPGYDGGEKYAVPANRVRPRVARRPPPAPPRRADSTQLSARHT